MPVYQARRVSNVEEYLAHAFGLPLSPAREVVSVAPAMIADGKVVEWLVVAKVIDSQGSK